VNPADNEVNINQWGNATLLGRRSQSGKKERKKKKKKRFSIHAFNCNLATFNPSFVAQPLRHAAAAIPSAVPAARRIHPAIHPPASATMTTLRGGSLPATPSPRPLSLEKSDGGTLHRPSSLASSNSSSGPESIPVISDPLRRRDLGLLRRGGFSRRALPVRFPRRLLPAAAAAAAPQ
jgi:hypothetical protein